MTNPIIIRKAEKRDLKDIHFNDTALYRTSIDGSKSISLEYIEDFFKTYNDGICVAEDSNTRIIVGHALCFPFKFKESNYDFVFNTKKVSELYDEKSEHIYGKSFVVLPEYRKFHVAYGLLKWSYMFTKENRKFQTKSVFGLCESDNRSRKLHYLMGYRPKFVFNNMFKYENSENIDGILLEVNFNHMVDSFLNGSFKKWFGVKDEEPGYK